jgi:GDP-D-mannose dehydratase
MSIAFLASYLVMKQLNRGGVKANVALHRVVMTVRDLDVGAKLAEDDLRLADWAVGDPPKEAFFKIQDAVGRAVLYPTYKDEIILGNRLASVGAGAGMGAVIPPGMRAVSIRVDVSRLRPVDTPELRGDPSKMRDHTGWTAKLPIQDTLKSLLEYWDGMLEPRAERST